MIDPSFVDLFERLGLALALGFLVGVERGWTHRRAPEGSRAAGLRTHAIIGLFGGVCGALLPAIGGLGFAALTLAFAAAFLTFKWLESQRDKDVSVTGTISGLLVFALGALAVVGDRAIAASAGVTLVVLLGFKHALHDWLAKLTWEELRSALLILAATAIALPLLPDRAIDPWSVINPHELWLMTILVAGASFVGYAAVRILGPDAGLFAGAASMALVSSTLVTGDLGRRVKSGETAATPAAAAAALAAAVSLARVGLLVAALAPTSARLITPALVAAVLAFSGAAYMLRRLGQDHFTARADGLRSPLALAAVAKFAALLGGVVILGRIVMAAFGDQGLAPFAAAAGLADVDAATLAASALVRDGLDPAIGASAILLAALVNSFAKTGVAWATGGAGYAMRYLAVALFAAGAAAAAWAVTAQLFPTPAAG